MKTHNHDGTYFKYLGSISDPNVSIKEYGYYTESGDSGSKNFPNSTGKGYGVLLSFSRSPNSRRQLHYDNNGIWIRNYQDTNPETEWIYVGGLKPNNLGTAATLGSMVESGSWIDWNRNGYQVQVNFWIKMKSTCTNTFSAYAAGTGLPTAHKEVTSPAMLCDNGTICYISVNQSGTFNVCPRYKSVAGTVVTGGFIYWTSSKVF